MKKFIQNTSLAVLLAGTVAFGTAGIAQADTCADAIAALEEGIAEVELSDDDKATIEQASASAQQQQANGDVEGCTATLAEPLKMIQAKQN